MKKLLLNNWPLKLVSVLLAVGIWMMVIYITDPATTQTYSVPIELVNEEIVAERGRSVTVVGDQTVNVRVTKNRSITRALSASNFRAVADFSKLYEDTQVPVTETCTSTRVQASDFTQDKFSLEVKLEDLKTVTVPIVYELNGEPAEGFAIGGVTLEPSEVTVTAPESYADIIREATVSIDVNGASEDFTTEQELHIYDGNGVLLNPAESKDTVIDAQGTVACSVKLFLIKKVPVIVEAKETDRVAEGYQYVGASATPETVTISGTRAVMAQVSSIIINDVSAAGLAESRRIEVDLTRFLPANVSIVDDVKTATVILMAEPFIERTFEFSRDQIEVINVPENMEYRILSSTVALTLRGLEADLSSLDTDAVKLTLDLNGYSAGNLNVVVNVTLPSDVYTQKGACVANVRLTEIEVTEAETGADE